MRSRSPNPPRNKPGKSFPLMLVLALGLASPMPSLAADTVTINGQRSFTITPQTTFSVDGTPISAAAAVTMGPGYSAQVIIENVDPGVTSGDAVNVDLRTLARGPITATQPLSVLNQALTVTAETVLVGIPGDDLANLAVGDLLEVSGFPDPNGAMAATRIELRTDPTTDWKLFGQVSGLNPPQFFIGAQAVDFSGVTPTGCVPELQDGQYVEIESLPNQDYTPASVLTSLTQVHCEDPNFNDPPGGTGPVSLEGIISALPDPMPSPARFSMLGIEVITTAQTEYRAGTVDDLDEGVRVEVEGVFDDLERTITATEVRFVQGQVRFEAPVEPADVSAGESIRIMGSSVNFTPQTRDEDGIVSGLASATQVEVRGLIDRDGQLFATRVRERGNPDLSDTEIRGPVAVIEAPNLTILGITVDTSMATFRDHQGNVITADEFFARVYPGTLVSAEDAVYDPATAFLAAREIELEEDTLPAPARAGTGVEALGVSRGTLTGLGFEAIFADGFD